MAEDGEALALGEGEPLAVVVEEEEDDEEEVDEAEEGMEGEGVGLGAQVAAPGALCSLGPQGMHTGEPPGA